MKPKSLSPTLRERKRYVVFEVISDNSNLDVSSISNEILKSFLAFAGTLNVGKAGPIFLNNKFNHTLKRGIVRIEHNYVDHFKSSLLFVKQIGNDSVIIKSVGVSGIIKKALQRYFNESDEVLEALNEEELIAENQNDSVNKNIKEITDEVSQKL